MDATRTEEQKKTPATFVRLSGPVLDFVKKSADELGMSRSSYVRMCVLEKRNRVQKS